ncbi:hypothetical protein [Microvirga makkahensis]|uniref:Uncharacterized protein n=1 Tax=Microvirga makkahensis TaxID=1128670 RepID=A0A7X3MWM5_9HYPH|nr:hypothetical protein [Microvirga makkahensis]MXQ14636.1 hypothetical protein [Microvirga makkahensis]
MSETWPLNRGYFVNETMLVGPGLVQSAFYALQGSSIPEADPDEPEQAKTEAGDKAATDPQTSDLPRFCHQVR